MRTKIKKGLRRFAAYGTAGVLLFSIGLIPQTVSEADSVEVRPYIAFGADLSGEQKNKVMQQMGISSDTLADYEVVEVTNQEEHNYLDDYLDTSVIGTRALSSVMIEEADSGSGIHVETHNITFCTDDMYTNALVTAGISDASVIVAAPFEISGTAALVGAMKAYGTMTGEVIDSDNADAATNELVVTAELGNELGKEKASQFVALVKDKVVSQNLVSGEEIMGAIEEAADELSVTLTAAQKNQIRSLMEKISGLDLDLDTIKDQAQGIYDKLRDLDIDLSGAEGVWEQICEFFKKIVDAIADFLKGLF